MHIKRQAVELYLEGLGFRSIGRFLNVSHVAAYNWIRVLAGNWRNCVATTRLKSLRWTRCTRTSVQKKRLLDMDCC